MTTKYCEYKDSQTTWMGEVPSHWKLERAKWHFTLRNERGNSIPVLLAATQKYGMYPQDMIEGVVKVAEDTDVQLFRTVHKNDFVISLRSFQGGFERSDYEGVCSPAYQVFYANDQWNNNYLKYLFKNELFVDAMNALTVGIREGRNIKFEDFANSILAIPPMKEQEAIAEYLGRKIAHIDSIIAEAKASIEEYKAWKASIIYEAVTKGLDPNVEMKDSGIEWIGKMPNHWKLTPFKHVLSERNERNDPIVSTERLSLSIDLGVTLYADKTTNLDRLKEDFAQYKLAHEGDLVMNSMNMIVGASGVSAWFGCVSPAYYTFYDNESDHITAKFCEYVFRNKAMLRVLHSMGKGIYSIDRGDDRVNTCRLKVAKDELRCVLLPVPPLEEQRRIVSFLYNRCKNIDDLIAEKEALIIDLESYKKALVFEVVTGKRKVY